MSTLVEFDTLWNHDDPVGTEVKFRALVPAAEAAGDDSYRLQLGTQIARTLSLQRRFEEAHALLDEIEPQLTPDLGVARVRYLLERGRTYNSSGEKEEARTRFLQAWEFARELSEDAFAVDAAHMLGIVEPPEEALAWNREAVELAAASSDPGARRWRGSLYNNLGWAVFEQGEHEQALGWFEKALSSREEEGDENRIRVARWCVAKAQRVLGRPEEALVIQQALLAEYEGAGGKDGYVFEELAECWLALGRDDEARPWFARAWEELSQDHWLVENEAERIARLERLGAVTD